MMPPLFFSTFAYAACKTVGDAWPRVLEHLLAHPEDAIPTLGPLGYALATYHEARRLGDVTVHVSSNTYIPRARCVAAAVFLSSGHDVWLTVDDDNYADQDVVRRLVTACRETMGLVAIPYANRDGRSMTMRRLIGPARKLACGAHVMALDRVGLGMAAMHREFVLALDRASSPAHRFRDRPGGTLDCGGLFLAAPRDGDWVGEDFWMCADAESLGLPMHALLEATVTHADIPSRLNLAGQVLLYGVHREGMTHPTEAMNRAIEETNEAARQAGLTPPNDEPHS